MAYKDRAQRATRSVMRHFSVLASSGGESATVILESPTISEFSGGALDEEYSAVLSTSDLPTLARGSEIMIDGQNYFVREVYFDSDGVTKRAGLSRL